ncbi:hypothetical protein [Rathayibacter agropyri]|uniref:hypothetical protein n=1 Tax=Rathayibacter agropyri TaxID=1634927 RepID=UPI00156302FF|nr:hypothetical protein [Rathayibacter agropyri]NRD08406.1 hypothetical protein [Rathayibacter agropyri]
MRQCTAMSKRSGEQCKNYVGVGLRTCRMHGSATRRSKTAAAKRIAQAAGYAADLLAELMADPEVQTKERAQIAQDFLNRAGLNGKRELEVKISKWDEVSADIVIDVENLGPAPTFAYEDIVDADEVDDEWTEEQAYHRRNHTPARTDASDPAPPRRKVPRRRSGNVPPKMQASGDAPRQPGPVQSKPGTVAPPEHPPVDQDPRAREADSPRKRPRVAARRQKR